MKKLLSKVSDRLTSIDYESYRQYDGYFYYTYLILLTEGSLKDHYYLGQHRTKNLNDHYVGSGIILKNYFEKYDDFEFEILNFYHNLEELNSAEKLLIDERYKNDPLCLNLCMGGHIGVKNIGHTGKKHSEETKRKISESNIGKHFKKFSEEARHNMSLAQKGRPYVKLYEGKKVLQYNRDGSFVKEYNSIKDASKSVGISRCGISLCLTGKQYTAGGYTWKYKDPKYLLNLPSNKYP